MAVDAFTDPETSEAEIYRATYVALREHGFGELSIQRIADESRLGKSTLYHHFDSKDDLLTRFAAAFADEYVEAFFLQLEGDPLEVIDLALDLAILGRTGDGVSVDDLVAPGVTDCYLQLRVRALTDEQFRGAIGDLDATVRQRLADLVETGVARGAIRERVSPDRAAATLWSFLQTGLLVRHTSDDAEWLAHVRASADDYVDGIAVETADR